MNDKLKPLREQIDAIDAQILDLLNRRAKVAQEVGHVKAETNAPVFRPEREAQVLRGVAERNPGPMGNTELQTIWREIMSACRSLEKRVTIAFLGPAGTYSEQAVYQQFGTAVDVLPCSSIDEVFRATEAGTARIRRGAGREFDRGRHRPHAGPAAAYAADDQRRSVDRRAPQPVDRHRQHGRHHRHLRARAALAQCQIWLNNNYPGHRAPRRVVERRGGAHGARRPRHRRHCRRARGRALQPGHGQGQHPGRSAHNIQDDPHNRTRFAVIGHLQAGPSGEDRTSLALAAPHKAGSIYRLLGSLAQHNVSMTRFESRPARTGTWEYYFYVDVEGHVQNEAVAKALDELQSNAAFFKVLGSYPVSLN